MEGDRVLGITPLSLDVDAASVARAPRELWLKQPGHVPYRVVQGASERDVRVVATLVAVPPAASAEAAAKPDDDSPRPSARRRASRSVTAAKTQEPAPAVEASDIRLER